MVRDLDKDIVSLLSLGFPSSSKGRRPHSLSPSQFNRKSRARY
jgi:hypothetical protein